MGDIQRGTSGACELSFPEKQRILHLFSGRVDVSAFPGDTVDINPALKPTYLDDAQSLTSVPLARYDLILADPPYSIEDAERYQTTMVKRNTVMRALQRVLPGTHIIWLDQVLPMYRKDKFEQEAVIGMWKSTNHRFRGITIFCRRDAERITAMRSKAKKFSHRSLECPPQPTLEAASAINPVM